MSGYIIVTYIKKNIYCLKDIFTYNMINRLDIFRHINRFVLKNIKELLGYVDSLTISKFVL